MMLKPGNNENSCDQPEGMMWKLKADEEEKQELKKLD